jgi:fatty acid desaturase
MVLPTSPRRAKGLTFSESANLKRYKSHRGMATSPRVNECKRRLLPVLPADAFRAEPRRLLVLLAHWAIIALGVFTIAHAARGWIWPLVALLSGQSFASLGFLAHDLSHGTIVRQPRLRYALELLAWSPLLVPVTVWRLTHHRGHHLGANTLIDQDRKLAEHEMGHVEHLYFGTFYPHAGRLKFNPLLGLHFVAFITRLTLAQLFWNGRRMPSLPRALVSSMSDRVRIGLEIIFMLALQLVWLVVLEGNVIKLFFATLLPLAIGSTVATLYLVTNHFLRPHQIENDPLASSTSIVVPRWMDVLHAHFSYHVEHHLFPNVRSRYYPILSLELQSQFGPDYHRIGLLAAWRQLLAGPAWQTTGILRPSPSVDPGITRE